MAEPTSRDEQRRQTLATLRRQAGFSQESLADHLQASRSSIFRWEAGDAVPQPRLLALWAEALGIESDELDELLWSGDSIVRTVAEDEGPEPEAPTHIARPGDDGQAVSANLIGDTGSSERSELPEMTQAIASVLGLSQDHISQAADLQVAIALSSFRGSSTIDHEAAAKDLGGKTPSSFVQAYDDVANDYFFGKRDVLLANQITGALTSIGFKVPIYVEDRSIWRQLGQNTSSDEALVIRHESESYNIDILIAVGFWSNVLVTGLADWNHFPEFQMAGDPTQHASRTIRIASSEGLRILDLNASEESEELGGNPAVIMSRELPGLHLVLTGGATSLSTLRLAELLTNPRIWKELARQSSATDQSRAGGSWLAIECPNAGKWKDRCRLVGYGEIEHPGTKPLQELVQMDIDLTAEAPGETVETSREKR